MTSPAGRRGRSPAHPSRAKWLSGLRVVVGVALFAAVAIAASREWGLVRGTVRELSPATLVGAQLLLVAGLIASAMTWRATLLALGERVGFAASAKIYFVGQLGKYVPGSLWAFLLQMEMSTRANVARNRALTASLGAALFNLITAGGLTLLSVWAVLPLGAWIFVLLPVVLGAVLFSLEPRVLTWGVNRFLRLMRRPLLERPISWRGSAGAAGWSTASWVAYGLALWLLTTQLGVSSGEALPLCIGGMALAMSAGFLVVIAPSGIGVREAVIVATLAPVLDHQRAFALALVMRLLFTVGDLLVAVVALPIRIRPARTQSRSHGNLAHAARVTPPA